MIKNILIICKTFSPDSIVSAKRMTMFTKYLIELGNNVTVIRAGVINGKPDASFILKQNEKLKIISYNGDNSPAERFECGINQENSKSQKKIPSKYKFTILKRMYHFFAYYKDNMVCYRKTLQALKKVDINKTDIVLTTFAPLGSTMCGYYLKKKYQKKWIMDIRDLMDNPARTPVMRVINRHFQKKFACNADIITTPTQGFKMDLEKKTKARTPIYVIYNGFEDSVGDESSFKAFRRSPVLKFCYTGTIHNDLCSLSPLVDTLLSLIADGLIDKEKIQIDYAGQNSDYFMSMTNKAQNVFRCIDHGYLTRPETLKLQLESDVFVLMVMNCKEYTGVLTGKLCESMQCRMPVIGLVSGDLPYSELYNTIQKFDLGVCYEQSRPETMKELRDFIVNKYNEKNENDGSPLAYSPSQDCFSQFEYKGIISNLNKIMDGLV